MSTASIKAYEAMLPKRPSKIRQICEVLNKRGNQTTGELEFHTGLHYSTLTARLSDAWDQGLIIPLNESQDPKYSTWRLTTEDEASYVIDRRNNHRFIKWLKKGLQYENHIPKEFQNWMRNELGI